MTRPWRLGLLIQQPYLPPSQRPKQKLKRARRVLRRKLSQKPPLTIAQQRPRRLRFHQQPLWPPRPLAATKKMRQQTASPAFLLTRNRAAQARAVDCGFGRTQLVDKNAIRARKLLFLLVSTHPDVTTQLVDVVIALPGKLVPHVARAVVLTRIYAT